MNSLNSANAVPVRLLQKLALLGGIAFIAAAPFAPERAWSNLLVAAFYLATLSLGGALFVALAYITGASWNVAFRRVPEAMAGALPLAGVCLLAVLLVGMKRYGWHHHGSGDPGAFWFKEFWSYPSFWAARAAVVIGVWVVLSRAMIAVSRRQDQSGDWRLTLVNKRLSALFLAAYALTFSLASCDWLMMLEPMWFSTIWGVYNFSGNIQSTLAAIVIACLVLRRPGGPLHGKFTDEHLHDLGKLLLGFSCFWMYIWFSQYMLIWYSNIPEETSYFILRMRGAWGPIVAVNVALNWVVPFFVLLPRPCKRSGSVMAKIAVVVLIGRWVDLYVMVFPATLGATPVFGVWEVAGIVCLAGASGWLFQRSFSAAESVPRRDPLLRQSLHYHN